MSATVLRRWFINKDTKGLQVSDRNGATVVLPRFTKYETVPLGVCIVEPDLTASGINRYARVDISNLSLLVAIHSGLDTATPLTQQNSWTKDETDNVFIGELPMNVSAVNTFIGSNATVAAYLEIEWTETPTARSKVIIPITLENAVTQPGSVGPSPATEYYTKAEVDALFLANVNGAGRQATFTSPGNVYQRIIGVRDDGVPIDQVVPV